MSDRDRDEIAPRPGLELIEGYHSPQLDVVYRMNTNEAPESPPEEFMAALQAEIGELTLNRYPDLSAHDLRAAIGALHGVEYSHVFCANGSNEVLQSILLAYGGPTRVAATFEPTYAMHSHIARVTGTTVISGERNEEFLIDDAELERVIAEGKKSGDENPAIMFVCSPNNPTGRLEPRATIEHVLDRAPGLVVVDEAYGQFAPWSALELLGADRRLIVVRTFSKTWSLAGLRLGYAVADPKVIEALQAVTLPYHLDSLKQVAGRLALSFDAEMHARVARLVEERGRLHVGLSELGVVVCPSDSNFILFRIDDHDAKAVWRELVEQYSVLIRDVSGWPRLEGYLRVTVGTRIENDAFLRALGQVLAK